MTNVRGALLIYATMSKEFSRQFYNSMAWRRARDAYKHERQLIDGGICELCGEEVGAEVHHKIFLRPGNIYDGNVTLNPENFELLCLNCHHMRHDAARAIAYRAANERSSRKKTLQNGRYYFDEEGNIVPFKCVIVWGAPGSGKTTYAREHMQTGDIVIDLDLIGHALTFANNTDVPSNAQHIARQVRDYLYELISRRELDARCVWVVAGLPEREPRNALRKRLNAELIFVNADYRSCYAHIMADPERKDKAFQLAILDKWFRQFEPDDGKAPPSRGPA